MITEDYRQSKRRDCERRLDERRIVGFLFGSTEWRQNIERQYLMWPRIDRRALDRRTLERRSISRRLPSGSCKGFKSAPRVVPRENSRDILSKEEKAMLADLF